MPSTLRRKRQPSKSGHGRINARLSREDLVRVRELAAIEKKSTSDIVRDAVREYHAHHARPRRSAYEVMMESGLIGSMQIGPESSTEVSIHRAMDDVFRSKYPHHVRDAK